jgi:dual specificity tyrosine-phosphorylation-regulated kinase 2/3/4
LISAPTPLTARTSRTTTVVTNGGPPTPGASHAQSLVSSSATASRSYRTSQSQILNSLNSSRTLNGYAVCS